MGNIFTGIFHPNSIYVRMLKECKGHRKGTTVIVPANEETKKLIEDGFFIEVEGSTELWKIHLIRFILDEIDIGKKYDVDSSPFARELFMMINNNQDAWKETRNSYEHIQSRLELITDDANHKE